MQRSVIGLVLALVLTATAKADNLEDVRKAFTEGGAVVSCWNVNGGWNLPQQVAWLKAGHRIFPTIWVPLLGQGADNPNRWANWYTPEIQEALAYINANKLPITARYHNIGAGLYDKDERPAFEHSALVHKRMDDGTLEDEKLLDPLAPSEPWELEGQKLGGSLFLKKLAEVLPDVPRIYVLENNEAALGELGLYTDPVNEKDEWKIKKRKWKANLGKISVRMETFAKMHNANECEVAVKRGFVRVHEAFWKAFKANAPLVWKDKIYSGGYAGLGDTMRQGLNGQIYSYLRPQEDWNKYRWASTLYEFDELSERIYDDGSGSPFDWHDWVRGPHNLSQNLAPLTTELALARPLWHDDRSVWMNSTRCRAANVGHGGYVLPHRMTGFMRACLWAHWPKGKAVNLRWFATSQEELSSQWYDKTDDPPELKHLTSGDFFMTAVQAVDETWDNKTLNTFWKGGEPVLNPDKAFCNWVLPPDVVDTRSRILYTDADPPRFVGTKDTWRDSDGKMELKVHSYAWKKAGTYLVYAWSPRMTRESVTVTVPGLGPVFFDTVDQSGEFRVVETAPHITERIH